MTPVAGAHGSLAGLRVVDLSRVLAGPYCTQMLGDHGASVVKIEPPGGDETRSWGPPFDDRHGSAYFAGLNRNKRSIAVDLSTAAGRDILRRLLADADVVVENFKAGTMDAWGFGHEQLLEDHPRLVYCRITGFGVDGPMGGMPGYDAPMQAFSGLMTITGEADGPPVKVGVPVVDLATGMLAFSGILLALVERSVSGRGQLVDLSLLDGAVSLLHPQAANWFADGSAPQRLGAAHPNIAPYDTYASAAGPVFIAAANDRQFARLCRHLGRPALADDPRFASNGDRVRNREALAEEMTTAIAERDPEELTAELLRLGIPASPVRDIPEVLSDPHVAHRDMVVAVDGYRGLGVPIKLGRTPGAPRTPPPAFSEHADEVLAELGYDAQEIADLVEQGVVRGPAPASR